MTDLAFLRAVPDSFPRALKSEPSATIDLLGARAQHDVYRRSLVDAGYDVAVIEADDAHPDCPFIEDVAVVLGSSIVVAHPGAPSRRGEVTPVAEALGAFMPLKRIEPPGTLDGGDVLVIDDTVYVGRSVRTNDSGIAQLEEFAAEEGSRTISVDVSGVLHLKSAVGHLGEAMVLIAPDSVDRSIFSGYHQIEKAPGEEHLASVLRLKNGSLVVTASAPRTNQRMADVGFGLVPIDVSEFQTADGGLTCLSLLISMVDA